MTLARKAARCLAARVSFGPDINGRTIQVFDCCKQSLERLLRPSIHPSTHPSTHPGLYFFIIKNHCFDNFHKFNHTNYNNHLGDNNLTAILKPVFAGLVYFKNVFVLVYIFDFARFWIKLIKNWKCWNFIDFERKQDRQRPVSRLL